jgi:hypothetical protein
VGSVSAQFQHDWLRLWRLAERLAEPRAVFEPIGLFLQDPSAELVDGGYDDSPVGSVMFASTGGDGVHFSVLPVSDGTDAVVMTVPMQGDDPNHVLGASLPEFLALGFRTGYFVLEQLAYPWGRTGLLARLGGTAQHSIEDADRALVSRISREFGLSPWPDVSARLDELKRRHGSAPTLGSRRA